MMKISRNILILCLTAVLLAGCGSEKSDISSVTGKDTETAADTGEEKTEPVKEDDVKRDPAEISAEEIRSDKESLAKRLCGKYSCHINDEDSGESESYILNMITFGDNLYAFCGQAMDDDSDSLESYSFWACEFIPDNDSVLRNTDSDKAEVTALNFSIMSNLGKYWDSGVKGTITITDEGLEFEGFDNDGFLVPEHYPTRTFLKDDRVEDVFPYLNEKSREGDSELQGLWVFEGGTVPVYLRVDGGNFYIYRKSPEKEVYFAAGDCKPDGRSFSGMANVFGCGTMPDEWSGNYRVDGDKLYLTIEGGTLPEELSGEVLLNRINEEDIHVVTMDEVRFNEDSFGYYSTGAGAYEHQYENGFYGIWTSAGKDRKKAVDEAKKLNDLGYDSYVCYSPEWENLNVDEYYCVTTGRYMSEKEAQDGIEDVKAAGFKDAYIKNSGKRKFTTINYYNYGDNDIEVYSDKVILKNVVFDISRSWYPEIENSGEQSKTDLIIDEDTVFDEKCDLSFFGNYEEGDIPLEWFKKNKEYMESDPDKYMSAGPALSGVFEVGIRGNHIERFFGSYWWD